jgi:antitoxin component YwqK of YwqJK toxin-antitoxin module
MKTYTVEIDNKGTKRWYINDKLHREDGPACEYADGYKSWYINDKLHRKDGPAIEFANGSKEWYSNGKLHREDGPAVEWANEYKAWYINGKRVTEQDVLNLSQTLEIEGVKYSVAQIKAALKKVA